MATAKRVREELAKWLYRNSTRSNDRRLRIISNRVNLREWSVAETGLDYYNTDKPFNLGDTLSRVVVEWMLAREGYSLDTETRRTSQLMAVGSGIFHSYADATIWGSGAEYPPQNRGKKLLNSKGVRKLDIRAVRGPLTRDCVLSLGHSCPDVYGDPAILMPYIYTPKFQMGGVK